MYIIHVSVNIICIDFRINSAIYVCERTHTHARTHTHTSILAHTHAHTHILKKYTRTLWPIQTRAHLHTHTHTHIQERIL